MADKKITDLQLVDAITEDLNFPVDDTIQTYRATMTQVKTYVTPVIHRPSVESLTSGSGTWNLHYSFVVSGASATVGATYTHNSLTFTVIHTVASKNLVVMSASGAPTASGTLTKASGTGDSTIVFSAFKAPAFLKVCAVGGGGGGAPSGTASWGFPGAGGDTTFATTLVVGRGGGAGGLAAAGGTGGTASLGSGAIGYVIDGGRGQGSGILGSAPATTMTPSIMGAQGGSSFYGGNGGGGHNTSAGTPGQANTGGGGGGAAAGNSVANNYFGSGGGGGGYAEAIIHDPTTTYAYSIGAGGTAGTAGTNGVAGTAGGSGVIRIECHYQ